MTTRDMDAAVSRFLSAARRIRAGLTEQQRRIAAAAQDAPVLPTVRGLPETRDLTGTFANDVDYYIYELGRLRDLVAVEAPKTFGHQSSLNDALEVFDSAAPHLKAIRNALTHMDDTARLDRFATFSAAVDLSPDGRVVYLVDPRYEHHDAALKLLTTLETFLRDRLTASIVADPPAPIDEQIARRRAGT